MDQHSILHRAISEVIVEEELSQRLRSGEQLRLKEGFDPSRPDITLGHAVSLRKLRQFQRLGHKVVLIVGDWTAQIGDPSGRSTTRNMLTADEVRANAQTYLDQFFKIVDPTLTEVRWQSEWYSTFGLADVLRLTSKFTVAQMLARDDFAKRYSAGRPIAITEFMYPLLQAYDSVMVKADVEFGGTDQKFNILLGRELMSALGMRPQHVVLTPLLVGTDGVQKMSKSLGNYIGIAEPPDEMYGKVMSLPDSLIVDYFELVTDVPEDEIREMRAAMERHEANPRDIKMRLACEVVREFHGDEPARLAKEGFKRVFQRRELPDEMPTISLNPSSIGQPVDIVSLIVENGIVESRSRAKDLVRSGAIELSGTKVTPQNQVIIIQDGVVLKVGKHRFYKLTASS